MRSFALRSSAVNFSLALAVLLALLASACQQGAVTNTNTTANVSNVNTTVTNANITTAVPAGSVINAREPEKYSATLVFTAQTEGGDQAVGIPPLSAEVARSGADHRISFKLPNNEQLIYIDRADKHYVISPTRKQYAELTPEATGFEIQRLMTPGQVVAFLEKQRGYERVGEEPLNGRTAEKYRYANTTTTQTQAGNVQSEAFVYVDKETGLPLRATLSSQATGSVEGVKGVRIVAEMRDIKTDIDTAMFEVPKDYTQVTPQQVRQQIDVLTNTVAAVIKALLTNMNTSGGTTTTTTTTTTTAPSPSPSASASPAGR
ncbi:MAG TPA: hypothetical protein VM911_03600 [Pyrinomonadaceae bacterium]|jgi:PKD repeat protein|nr:hypothetical protein [Pyrinomonadaceae bacterium]